MDRSLLGFVVLSLLAILLLAPHFTMMLTTIIALSALFIWGSWAFLQAMTNPPEPERVVERVVDRGMRP